MSDVAVTLRVAYVRSRGKTGGAIFSGVTDDGEQYVAVCNHRLVPDATLPEKGQIWAVSGPVEWRTVVGDRFTRKEAHIKAVLAELLHPTGHNIIDWIKKCPDCRGIGRVKATDLWDLYGPSLVDVIENREMDKLMTVLTENSAAIICNAFVKHRVGTTLLWLEKVGISRRIGSKVLAYYGEHAQQKIEANPYVLVSFEADWRAIDDLARYRFLIAEDDPRRLEAAIEDALYSGMRDGHTCLPVPELKARLKTLLGTNTLVKLAIGIERESTQYRRIGEFFQPTGAYLIEKHIAERLLTMAACEELAGQESIFKRVRCDEGAVIEAVEAFERANFPLEEAQRRAVLTSASCRFSLILGGAGTGKTTVLKALYQALEQTQEGITIFQMALAGRAAQRMAEATGRESMTIAAFLANVHSASLDSHTAIVVDEASMVDAILMHRLLRRIPAGVRLILVGDSSQLPPIGPGLVLQALADHPAIPQTKLEVVQRQKASSGIPDVAAAVRIHQMPVFTPYAGIGSGVSFINCAETSLNDEVMRVYADLGGDGSGHSVQILSTTRSRAGGVVDLNRLLHDRYSKRLDPVEVFNHEFEQVVGVMTLDKLKLYVGDLVMFTENDYYLGMRNGSLGRIVDILPSSSDIDDDCCVAEFGDVMYRLKPKHLNALVHSYSITVHKSQGSQFNRVIVPITENRLLDMTLIYTAITRGVTQVVLVGDGDAAKKAILSPPSSSKRHVTLPMLLASGLT